MAFANDAKTYQLEMFKKKKELIIFNQENFYGLGKRVGTEKDVKALTETFGDLGFIINEHTDFTKQEIFETIRSLPSTRNNFSDYELITVAILTHGSRLGLRAKDLQYSDTEIIKELALVTQATATPLVLLIQACRGNKSVLGRELFHVPEAAEPYSLPVEADWLVHRTYHKSSPSQRNKLHKSPIQEFCEKLEDLWSTQDLETIMTAIRREFKSRTSEMGIIPNTTSTCIRKLYSSKSSKIESLSNQPRININSGVIKNGSDNDFQTKPFSNLKEHFNCMKKRLKFFVEENPHDALAKTMWQVANAIEEDDDDFNLTKTMACKAISKFLYNETHE